jgi:hypothetical protein
MEAPTSLPNFQQLPIDLRGNYLIQHLPVETLIQYCRTNKRFAEICAKPETWRYLLQRDFPFTYTGSLPKELYILAWKVKTGRNPQLYAKYDIPSYIDIWDYRFYPHREVENISNLFTLMTRSEPLLKALSTIRLFQNIVFTIMPDRYGLIYISHDSHLDLILTIYDDAVQISVGPPPYSMVRRFKITHRGSIDQLLPILPKIVEFLKSYVERVTSPPEVRRSDKVNITHLIEEIYPLVDIETY